MNEFLLLAALVCGPTRMVGWAEQEAMTEADHAALTRAKRGCYLKYKNSPCLVKFEKVEDYTYRATCGSAK